MGRKSVDVCSVVAFLFEAQVEKGQPPKEYPVDDNLCSRRESVSIHFSKPHFMKVNSLKFICEKSNVTEIS